MIHQPSPLLIEDFQELICLTRQYFDQEYPSLSLRPPSSASCAGKAESAFTTIAKRELPPNIPLKPLTHGQENSPAEVPIVEAVSGPSRLPENKPADIPFSANSPSPLLEEQNTVNQGPPQPAETVTAKASAQTFSFALEPLAASFQDPWTSMKPAIQKNFPDLNLLREPPDDALAKSLRESWKETCSAAEVIILSFQETEKQSELLSQIANAITILIKPAKVLPAMKIEQEKGWEQLLASPSLKLLMASDYAIYGLPELMKHYRELSKTAEHFLGKIPLFLLADMSLYLREPLLKPSLWRALRKHL